MRALRAALLLAVLAAACSVGEPGSDATGEEIYTQLCVNCHGDDLQGRIGPPLGPGSHAALESDEFLRFTIENGRGRMPSFSSVLNDAQVGRLIDYIREVQNS